MSTVLAADQHGSPERHQPGSPPTPTDPTGQPVPGDSGQHVGRGLLAPICWSLGILAVVTLATIVLGVEVGTPDGSGLGQRFDRAIAAWIAAHRSHFIVTGARGASLVGSPVVVTAVAAVLGIWLSRNSPHRRLRSVPFVSICAVQVAVQTAKFAVARPRPGSAYAAMTETGFAWPSGHAATAAAVATSVSLAISCTTMPARKIRRVRWALVGAATGIAASRVALGVHWSTDVLMGVTAGTAVSWAMTRQMLGRSPDASRPRPRRRRACQLVAASVIAAAIPIGSSYAHALKSPGAATFDVRTVEWIRDHGLNSSVDRAESWWLWRNAPSPTASLASLPAPPLVAAVPVQRAPHAGSAASAAAPPSRPANASAAGALPVDITAVLRPELPGEGKWTVAQASATGHALIATTVFRPDTGHPSVSVSLAWMNTAATRFELIRGTRQPGGGVGPAGGAVPPADRSRLLAAFNSGYKLKDTPGGAREEGKLIRPLQPGIATLGIRSDGTPVIMEWGRDPRLDASVVSARQNLHLLVDNGHVAAGLRLNVGGRWGTVKNALPTWRSGIGVDAHGNAIYAGGNGLTLDTLADALRRAGAITAMELDIHKDMVIYNLFTHDNPKRKPTGHKLSASMPGSADRYLTTDQRDFVMVVAR